MDQTVLDERAITQQLVSYCRAMDRCDPLLGKAVFHPGATADYGEMFRGSGEGFINFVMGAHERLDAHVHRVSNISVVIDGDRAGSEAYVDARFRMTHEGTPMELTSCGRFVDRWERRDGCWAITERRYLHCMDSSRPLGGARFGIAGTRDRTDISYQVLNAPSVSST